MSTYAKRVIRADGSVGTYKWLERPHRESGQVDSFLVSRNFEESLESFRSTGTTSHGSSNTQDRNYDALKKPELFLEFAALERSPSVILAFANSYGSLYLGELFDNDSTESNGMLRWGYGDSLRGWTKEIDLLHDSIKLWNAIDKPRVYEGDRSFLETRVKYSGNSSTFTYDGIRARHQTSLQHDFDFSRLEPEERGRLYLANTITENMFRAQGAQHSVTPQLENDGQRFTLNFISNSLVATLWFQFAQAVAGNVAVNECDECGNLFAVGGRQGHRDRRFCGGNCKQRSFQRKKREARKLENPSA